MLFNEKDTTEALRLLAVLREGDQAYTPGVSDGTIGILDVLVDEEVLSVDESYDGWTRHLYSLIVPYEQAVAVVNGQDDCDDFVLDCLLNQAVMNGNYDEYVALGGK